VRILVVEDEIPLATALRRGLEDELYAVDVVHDGEEALWAGRSGSYDAVILDLMLPRLSGLEVCRRLRAEGSTVPVLVLTARDATVDVVEGLDAGANDYLKKPFAFEELLARVRALLRATTSARGIVIEIGDVRIDTAAHRVSRGGADIEMTAKEYQLLEYLAVHRGEVVSKSRLADALWPLDCEPDSNAIEVHVARVRRKVDEGRDGTLIRTVRGAGYVVRDARA
jgi:DNA-binding response OmpR family regulator